MRFVRPSLLVLSLVTCLAAAPTSQPAYLAPDNFDFKTLLGPPPADDSQTHKDEVDRMLALQASRSPEEIKRCKSEEEVTVFAFSNVLGDWFNEKDLPETAAFMKDAYIQAKVVSNAAKIVWKRLRPPLADPRIQPCVVLEKTASYPSGHAVRGIMWATFLAEIFPEQKDALMARGKQIGDDRFLAGMHYPSDVVAGQKLGAEIAKRMLADPEFLARLEKVKEECLADAKAHH